MREEREVEGREAWGEGELEAEVKRKRQGERRQEEAQQSEKRRSAHRGISPEVHIPDDLVKMRCPRVQEPRWLTTGDWKLSAERKSSERAAALAELLHIVEEADYFMQRDAASVTQEVTRQLSIYLSVLYIGG